MKNLASDEASDITGIDFFVDGGRVQVDEGWRRREGSGLTRGSVDD
jgi:hypothetical protein